MEAIFIAIIIGIIAAIANKKKLEKPSSSKNAPNPMSLFGNTHEKRDVDNKKGYTPPVAITEVEGKTGSNQQIFRDEKLDSEIQADRLKIQEDYYLKKLELSEKYVEGKNGNNTLNIRDGMDLVNGIILSEVLGPPRSKKPYKRK